MKNLLFITSLILCISFSVNAADSIDLNNLQQLSSKKPNQSRILGDNWPWPFGSECPFPWDEVEGGWVVEAPEFSAQFIIRVTISPDMPGRYILSLSHVNDRGYEIASGHGYGGKDGKIIRAAMTYHAKGVSQSFWVMLRAFAGSKNEKNFNCAKSVLSLVITFRPMDCDCDDRLDEHYEMYPASF